jgi:hypothetical protein
MSQPLVRVTRPGLDHARYKFDLKHSGINVDRVLHFLMQDEANGKLKSFQDMRKHRDAMLWGSKVADKISGETIVHKPSKETD